MSANVFGDRFVSNREAAWHKLGKVFYEPVTAVAALETAGEYFVEKRPVMVELNGSAFKTGFYHIVRLPTQDDKREVVFGAPVHQSYELIGPRDICEVFDQKVVMTSGEPRGVETFGVLDSGRKLFLSTKVDQIKVRDELVEGYLVVYSPMYGNRHAIILTTFVRVVCENTLRVALSGALEMRTIPHHPGAKESVAKWLGEMYGRYYLVAQQANDAFLQMVQTKVSEKRAEELTEQAIPAPAYPAQYAGKRAMSDVLEDYYQELDRTQKRREAVCNLFGGLSPTLRSEETKGTAWGWYNAVAEGADCFATQNNAASKDVLWGGRGEWITNAFELAVKEAKRTS